MQPTIGRWRTRYLVAGEGRDGAARLDASVRARVVEAYESALEQTFGNDPAVWVLRHVRLDLTVVNPSATRETAIATRWGQRTCAAVVDAVVKHADDSAVVMRFEDTAAFIAQWIVDLLDGVAWDRWYYGSFAAYRGLSTDEAIRMVLLDNREHLAAVLRRLAVLRRVPQLLARTSPSTARALWRATLRNESASGSSESFRVLVHAAIAIGDHLELWTGAPPDASETLEAWCATSPRLPDWTEPRALAEAVLGVLRFLRTRGSISDDPRGDIGATRMATAVDELAWLDREWLAAALGAWVRGEAEVAATGRPPGPTALQMRIREVLRRMVESGAVSLPDATERTSERNALTLLAALAFAEPSLAAEAVAPAAIASFLKGAPEPDAVAATEVPAMRRPPSADAAAVVDSAHAGHFLLIRSLLDARLIPLAEAFGLDVRALLLALAAEWQADVLDAGVIFWAGGEGEAGPLDPEACEAVRREVVRIMRDRAAFAPSLAPHLEPDCLPVEAIAHHLLRLWAHWLPGLGASSPSWLLSQLVLRPGRLRIDAGMVAVSLAPANLDVVLAMARYLDPIAAVPWLGGRRITFTIDRSLG